MTERTAQEPDLGGRTAVVTGSTRGIGRAIATALVAGGANVAVSGRTASDVREAAEAIDPSGPGTAWGTACDVRKREDCRRLIDEAADRFGGIDILVNNAGVGYYAPIQEMSAEDWDRQIRTNLDGVFHCSQAAIRHLLARGGGWIFNIGSLAGRYAFAGGTAYNASKWGLLGLSEAMMLDLRHDGIRVSCVMPGSVRTQFAGRTPGGDDDWKLRGEDVARAVVDLLAFPGRALPSRVELRPSRPPRK